MSALAAERVGGAAEELALRTRDLWCGYPGRPPALRGVDLEVEAGSVCMVLGPSGSGKSTLLKAVKGLVAPERGAIELFGEGVVEARARIRDPRIAYEPQRLGLVRSSSALDNCLAGALGRTSTIASWFHRFAAPDVAEAHALLERLGIGAKAGERVGDLSGGERQRVAIARALMQRPRLVLADEFVSQLDLVTTAVILELVREVARTGVTFVVSSHEVDLVARYGDTAVFLRAGEKVHEGEARGVDAASATARMGRS